MNPDTDLIVKALERAKQIQDTQSTGIDYTDEKQYKISVRKREKIQSIVKNPQTANLLSPKDAIGCKRTCLDTNYFETYNRKNLY